jgi:hypothetical protein
MKILSIIFLMTIPAFCIAKDNDKKSHKNNAYICEKPGSNKDDGSYEMLLFWEGHIYVINHMWHSNECTCDFSD